MRFWAILPSAAVIAALLAAAPAGAQFYRSVGPDGRVTYSDIPPAATAAGARDSGPNGSGTSTTSALPYELAQAAQKYPVTLYASPGCTPCDSGRSLLIKRGIPFAEKTVESNDDIVALKEIAGSASLPLLTIGGQQISGFQDDNWSQYLNAAGYPATSQLPGGYQRPGATALAPKPPATVSAAASAAAEAQDAPAESAPIAPPPDPGNPAGIRF